MKVGGIGGGEGGSEGGGVDCVEGSSEEVGGEGGGKVE